MTTKPANIRDVLRSLIASTQAPGCNIWACQITDELRRALREIERLDRELEQAGLFAAYWKGAQ